MKKIFLLVLCLLAGCASGGHDEALFGEWNWNADAAYTYIFNEDGTGERGFPETRDPFTWETRGERLNIFRENALHGEVRDEVWDYEIEDALFTITSRQREDVYHSYLPAVEGNNPALIGEWSLEEGGAFTYIFHDDGTGTRGFPDGSDSFTWSADDSRLNIIRDKPIRNEIRGELWTFELSGNRLSMTSLHKEDFTQSYISIEIEEEEEEEE
jgi:hypothetical protein